MFERNVPYKAAITDRHLVKRPERFSFQYYQWHVQSMVFAIEEINKNPNFLPNITIGFQIYDTCRLLQQALHGVLWTLTGNQQPIPNYRFEKNHSPSVIIGESGSTRSIMMARILGLYRYPQISFFSTSALLSDRTQFPSFLRTIPSDAFQSLGLAQLVMNFSWTWVGLLADDTDYGQQGVHILKQELAKAGACVAFSENILTNRADKNAFHIVQVIKKSTANAIVIFCSDALLVPLVEEMLRQNVTGKIWVASEAWSTSPLLSAERYAEILTGTIGFAIHSGELPGFKDHLSRVHPTNSPDDIFLRMFWEEHFGCKWLGQETLSNNSETDATSCTRFEKRRSPFVDSDVIDLRITYNIYTSVYAIAMALQDLISCQKGEGPFVNGTCADIVDFKPWQLLHYLKTLRLQRRTEAALFFDDHGNPPALYDIVNWQRGQGGTLMPVMVGSYDASALPGEVLTINASLLLWAAESHLVPLSLCNPSCPVGFWKAAKPGHPACCYLCVRCAQGEISNQTDSTECSKCPWDCWPNEKQDHCRPKNIDFLSYKEPLGVTLATVSVLLSTIPLAILALFLHHRDTPIVRANNRSLSYFLLLSFTLCSLSSLAFIGYPTLEKCRLRQVAFGISFALCVSCILAKTIIVVIAFNATKPNSDLRRWVGPKLSYMVISSSTFIQVLLCVLWLILSPPFPNLNIHTDPGKIIVECNDGSSIAFWCMLGYLGLLATISFMVAFLARKLPDSFNEAKYITFSMLAFLSVWISFIPAYLSTKGKYTVAMEIFAILSSSSALVFCIFLPKCYIIQLRPEMNSKEYLMDRGASHSSKIKRN
ncbi:extracellular calcium-sensing receptor-like [Ambystoma mexicanum]|uniref:extracellular calcium-sensing receptor-like n=1 Tax=Ambystoma mexicanum TaxID=8296 RepID=UPI0037E9659F